VKTVEDIFIERGEIEDLWKGTTPPLNLWRALHDGDPRANVLYPDLEQRVLPNGRIRDADVELFTLDGVSHVRAVPRAGTSTMDAPGMFGAKGWQYLVIPAGTVIPPGLVISRDHVMHIRGKTCRHYSISPNYSMPLTQYLLLLDQLAANAKIELRNTSHG